MFFFIKAYLDYKISIDSNSFNDSFTFFLSACLMYMSKQLGKVVQNPSVHSIASGLAPPYAGKFVPLTQKRLNLLPLQKNSYTYAKST